MTSNDSDMPEGVRMLRMPIPFPHQSVNLFLIARPDGHVLVNAGPDTPQCRRFVPNSLYELGIDLSKIRLIVLTHYHVDHYGMAGWLKRQCRAPVAVSKLDSQRMVEYCRGEEDIFTSDADFLRRFGMPESDITVIDATSRAVQRMTTPAEPEIDLVDGIPIEGTTFRAIWTPGHTPGHMCLWDDSRRVLISGDHVLTRITSNIGFRPDSGSDPLGTYLNSIRRVESLGA